jgi:hypothetical protein
MIEPSPAPRRASLSTVFSLRTDVPSFDWATQCRGSTARLLRLQRLSWRDPRQGYNLLSTLAVTTGMTLHAPLRELQLRLAVRADANKRFARVVAAE